MGRKFLQIALSRTVKEIEANLCFFIFGENIYPGVLPPQSRVIFENYTE